MDPKTKANAHLKLRSMKKYIGYPDELLDNQLVEDFHDGLEINPSKFNDNFPKSIAWYLDNKLGKQVIIGTLFCFQCNLLLKSNESYKRIAKYKLRYTYSGR